MWKATAQPVPSGVQVRLLENGVPLSFRRWFELLEHDAEFIDWYGAVLLSPAFDAVFWELPPLTAQTIDADAEFVLIESVELAGLHADPIPFRSEFSKSREADVITFPNLGGDALLIVPTPRGDAGAYPHLTAFLRMAPDRQVEALWRTTALCFYENLGESPIWLSTAGLGVAWLHLRLDSRPKYYRYDPYKSDRFR